MTSNVNLWSSSIAFEHPFWIALKIFKWINLRRSRSLDICFTLIKDLNNSLTSSACSGRFENLLLSCSTPGIRCEGDHSVMIKGIPFLKVSIDLTRSYNSGSRKSKVYQSALRAHVQFWFPNHFNSLRNQNLKTCILSSLLSFSSWKGWPSKIESSTMNMWCLCEVLDCWVM